MRLKNLVLFTAGVATLGCTTSERLTSEVRNVVFESVRARVDGWVEQVNAQNRDSLLTFYLMNDALTVGWTSGALSAGAEAHEVQLANFFDQISFISLNVQNPTIDVVSRTVAVVTFRYSVDLQRVDTSRDPYSGLGLQVWMQDPDDGAWRLQHHLMSRND